MELGLFFMAYAFYVRIEDVTVRSVHVFDLSVGVARRIVPRGEVVTFQVFFQRSCVFVRVRYCCVLRKGSSFLVRVSRDFMRTREEESNEAARCGQFFEN